MPRPNDLGPVSFWPAILKSMRWLRFLGLSVALSVRAGTVLAQTRGSVLLAGVGDAETRGFVANADVTLRGLRLHSRTDSMGKATISGIPEGTYYVVARRLGYVPLAAPVRFSGSDSLEVILLMQPAALSLDTVRTTESAVASWLREFEERRRTHIGGYFITGDDIRRANGATLSSLVSAKIPGVQVVQGTAGTAAQVYSTRGPNALGTPCQVAVFLDGVRLLDGDAGLLDLPLLGGVEYYPPGFVPVQYRVSAPLSASGGRTRAGGSSSCGVMLLWSGP